MKLIYSFFVLATVVSFAFGYQYEDKHSKCVEDLLSDTSVNLNDALEICGGKRDEFLVNSDDARDIEHPRAQPIVQNSKRRRETTYRRQSGKQPKTNGCSVPFGLDFFYKDFFKPACNTHDICYHHEEVSRRVCDNKFYLDMKRLCKHGDGDSRKCAYLAYMYYLAARWGGSDYYG